MKKTCLKCGNLLSEDIKICPNCKTIVSEFEAENDLYSVKVKKGSFRNYFRTLFTETIKLFKDPKALLKTILPSLIIAFIWFVLAILEMTNPKNSVIRTLSFFTYAQGGMFGGFFGALGGIIGKALFAYLLCNIVNVVINKKKINFKKILIGLKINSLSALSCFLIGAGVALLLYLMMNITSSAQNAMIGIVGAVMVLMAMGQKNGLILMVICGFIKIITRGKSPSQMTISRVFSGMAAGFVIAVPLSLPRSGLICPIVCLMLILVGVLILIISSKGRLRKAIATMSLLTITMSLIMSICVNGASEVSSGDWVDPYEYWNFTNDSTNEMYKKMRDSPLKAGAFELKPILYEPYWYSDVGHYEISDFTPSDEIWVVELEKKANDFKINYSIEKNIGDEQSLNDSYEVNIKNLTISLAENATYMYKCEYMALGKEKAYCDTKENGQIYYIDSYEGSVKEIEGEFDLDIYKGMVRLQFHFIVEGERVEQRSSSGMAMEKTSRGGNSTIVFQVTRVRLSDDINAGLVTGTDNSEVEEVDDGIKKGFDGVLYKPSETRKGVLLKDYDKDGDIDYLDRVIQYELIHDPDYLTRNGTAGTIIIAIMSILSGIIGGAAGAVAGISGALGASIGTASGTILTSGIVSSPYIKFDGVGDIEWTDPATGKVTQYIKQEDGTYKNPLTDMKYTYEELYDNATYRERNVESFKQDAEIAAENVEEQRVKNGEISDHAKEHEEVLRQLEKISEDREKMINLANKYYLSPDMDKDEFVKAVLEKLDKEKARGDEYAAQGNRMEMYEKGAEMVSSAADLSMDALATATGPAGKAINAAYKVGKGAAGKGAEEANYSDGNIATGIMQGAIEGGIDAANDYLDGGTKAAGTIVGESVKGGLDAYINGEDVVDGMKEGAASGVLNATIDAGTDAIGKGLKNATAAPKGIPIDESVYKTAEKTASAVDVGTNVAGNITKKVADED